MSLIRKALLGFALSVAASGAALAQGACPPGVPAQVFCGGKNFADAAAGSYKLDTAHTGVVARVSHIGYSYSVFRFGDATGQLAWDPADPARNKLAVTVKTASIETPVQNLSLIHI